MTPGIFSSRLAKRKGDKVNWDLFNGLKNITEEYPSIVDMGCGLGKYVKLFRDEGKEAYGFDGIENVEEISKGVVYQQDLTKRFAHNDIVEKIGWMDVAICIEVGEHIPAEHSWTFIDNICSVSSKLLIVSWAVPGQRGSGHISCHTPEWVVAQVTSRSWGFDEERTQWARRICGRGFKNKILVFEDEG